MANKIVEFPSKAESKSSAARAEFERQYTGWSVKDLLRYVAFVKSRAEAFDRAKQRITREEGYLIEHAYKVFLAVEASDGISWTGDWMKTEMKITSKAKRQELTSTFKLARHQLVSPSDLPKFVDFQGGLPQCAAIWKKIATAGQS